MLRVITHHLTPDLAHARPDLGASDRGLVDPETLIGMLETFRLIDPVENHDAQPSIEVSSGSDRFLLRTLRQKLFLHDPRTPATEGVELDPRQLREVLTGASPAPAAAGSSPVRRHVISVAILLAGLAINAAVVRATFRPIPVEPPPTAPLLTEPREIAALQHSAHGHYRTGSASGDRALRIGRDGRIEFLRLTASGERPVGSETFQLARDGREIVLRTGTSGLVRVRDIDTLLYSGDVYRRVR
ncbi:MAG TPA: hypothetical protein VEQ65_07885 [Opitutus sp.]|nr:hypothetical protein [Opitutus sp.]